MYQRFYFDAENNVKVAKARVVPFFLCLLLSCCVICV